MNPLKAFIWTGLLLSFTTLCAQTANKVPKFTGTGTNVVDSTITDNGTTVSISTSASVSGAVSVSGTVGVGTTTPATKLHIKDGSNANVTIESTYSTGPQINYKNAASTPADWFLGVPGSTNSDSFFLYDNSSGMGFAPFGVTKTVYSGSTYITATLLGSNWSQTDDTNTEDATPPAFVVKNTGNADVNTGQDIMRLYPNTTPSDPNCKTQPNCPGHLAAIRVDAYGNLHMGTALSIAGTVNGLNEQLPSGHVYGYFGNLGTADHINQFMLGIISDELAADPLIALKAAPKDGYDQQPLIVGFSRNNARSSTLTADGTLKLTGSGSGIVLKSPGGTCANLTLSDSGTLVTTVITCPF